MPIKILYMPNRISSLDADGPFMTELLEFAELRIVEQCKKLDEKTILAEMRQTEVLLNTWGSCSVPAALADDPGCLRYIIHANGTCRGYVPIEIVRSGIPITNWGDAPADCIAEGAMALLLAVLKDLRGRTARIAAGKWSSAGAWNLPSGTLKGTRLGVFGYGAIGRRFVELVRPFHPQILIFDPYVHELPEDCQQIESLDALCRRSEILTIHAGLNEATRLAIGKDQLALLPDHGIVVNIARGEIVDQDALFAELKSGRLRAGLDVLENPDCIPASHEARSWPNLLLTCHDINSAHWPDRPAELKDYERIALDNLRRFQRGEALRFLMDEKRYLLSS